MANRWWFVPARRACTTCTSRYAGRTSCSATPMFHADCGACRRSMCIAVSRRTKRPWVKREIRTQHGVARAVPVRDRRKENTARFVTMRAGFDGVCAQQRVPCFAVDVAGLCGEQCAVGCQVRRRYSTVSSGRWHRSRTASETGDGSIGLRARTRPADWVCIGRRRGVPAARRTRQWPAQPLPRRATTHRGGVDRAESVRRSLDGAPPRGQRAGVFHCGVEG